MLKSQDDKVKTCLEENSLTAKPSIMKVRHLWVGFLCHLAVTVFLGSGRWGILLGLIHASPRGFRRVCSRRLSCLTEGCPQGSLYFFVNNHFQAMNEIVFFLYFFNATQHFKISTSFSIEEYFLSTSLNLMILVGCTGPCWAIFGLVWQTIYTTTCCTPPRVNVHLKPIKCLLLGWGRGIDFPFFFGGLNFCACLSLSKEHNLPTMTTLTKSRTLKELSDRRH